MENGRGVKGLIMVKEGSLRNRKEKVI